MIRRIASVLVGAVVVVVFLVGTNSPKTAALDPRVVEDTANGQVGHFVVLLRRQTDVAANLTAETDRRARRARAVVALRQDATDGQRSIMAQLSALGARARPYWLVNAIAVEGGRDVAEAVAARPDVLLVEPDRAFVANSRPPATRTPLPDLRPQATSGVPWNIQQIHAPDVWALGVTGQGMVFAEPDTGVQWDHPALKPNYRGWNGSVANHNYNWWDAIHSQIASGPSSCGYSSPAPCDDYGHGTMITGSAVGDDRSTNHIGVAPGATWIACRDQDQGVGQPSAILECLQFLMAPTDLNGNNPDPRRGADALNNSYTCPTSPSCDPQFLVDAVANLRSAGIFVTSAAGNDGPSCGSIQDPISFYSSVVTVGGTAYTSDNSDVVDSFSSRGPVTQDGSGRSKPELVAPSEAYSSFPPDFYANQGGTSFSAPEVGAVALLLWSARPSLRGDVGTTLTLLEQSAVPLMPAASDLCGGDVVNQVPNNTAGYGRVDALAAYQSLGSIPFPTVVQDYLPVVSRDFPSGS